MLCDTDREHLIRCFSCTAAFTMGIWQQQDYVCPTCKESIGDVEEPMIYVECEICGREKPSLNPTEDYCCQRLMTVVE